MRISCERERERSLRIVAVGETAQRGRAGVNGAIALLCTDAPAARGGAIAQRGAGRRARRARRGGGHCPKQEKCKQVGSAQTSAQEAHPPYRKSTPRPRPHARTHARAVSRPVGYSQEGKQQNNGARAQERGVRQSGGRAQ